MRRELTDRYYIIAFNNADAVGGLNDVMGTELLLGAAVERAESLMYQYDVLQVFDRESGEYKYMQRGFDLIETPDVFHEGIDKGAWIELLQGKDGRIYPIELPNKILKVCMGRYGKEGV